MQFKGCYYYYWQIIITIIVIIVVIFIVIVKFQIVWRSCSKTRPSDVGKSENYGVYISVTAKFFVCWTCMVIFIIYS